MNLVKEVFVEQPWLHQVCMPQDMLMSERRKKLQYIILKYGIFELNSTVLPSSDGYITKDTS